MPEEKEVLEAANIPKNIVRFKEIWESRNPQHEINCDTFENMFWGTAELVAREYVAWQLKEE